MNEEDELLNIKPVTKKLTHRQEFDISMSPIKMQIIKIIAAKVPAPTIDYLHAKIDAKPEIIDYHLDVLKSLDLIVEERGVLVFTEEGMKLARNLGL
ncbi:MAG: hypothetical protein HY929_00770 [Euryarchaeota archaeon]|nr:hypothetical protein [Euryarchaeota archaeon]